MIGQTLELEEEKQNTNNDKRLLQPEPRINVLRRCFCADLGPKTAECKAAPDFKTFTPRTRRVLVHALGDLYCEGV